MPTITDLTVDVGMNLASLRQGVAEMTDLIGKAGAEATRSFDGVSTRLDAVGSAIKSLAAVAGVTLTFGFVKGLVADSIEAQAGLVDLGLRAGISASQISALIPAAKLSGASLEEVAIGAGKFSKTLVEIEAGTGKGAAAFKALGFSAQDAARFLKNPQQGLVEVAQAASKYADDGNKVAAVQLLMGKSAAQLLPFLHDLAAVGADQVLVTDEQAAAAKRLHEEWALYQIQQEQLRNQVVAEMVPSLIALVRVLDQVAGAAGGSREGIQELIRNGQIAAWAAEAGSNLARFADVLADGPRILRPYAESIGLAITALLDFGRASAGAAQLVQTGGFKGLDEISAAYEDFRKNLTAVKQAFKEAEPPASTKFFDQFTSALIGVQLELGKTSATANTARPSLSAVGESAEKGARQLTNAIAAYDKALGEMGLALIARQAAIDKQLLDNAQAELDRAFSRALISFHTYYDQRVEAQREGNAIEVRQAQAAIENQEKIVAQLDALRANVKPSDFKSPTEYARSYYEAATKVTEAQTKLIGLEGQLTVARAKGLAIGKDYIEQLVAQSDGLLKTGRALEQEIAARDRANEEIGLTATQVAQLNVVRLIELKNADALAALDPEVAAFYDHQIDGAQRLAASIGKGEATQKLIDGFKDLESGAKSVFDILADDADDKFKRIGASLKKWVLDLIYQLTIKPIIISIGAQIFGVGGNALANATQPGGLIGLLAQGSGGLGGLTQGGGLLSNLFGGQGGGLGGLGSSFALSGIGGALGLSAPVTSIAGGLSLGVEAGAATAAGITSLTAAGSALVAAIPVVGWALAAAAAIYAIVSSNKKPSPVEGQFAFQQATTGFEDNAFTSSKFGNIGFLDQGTQQFSGEAGQVLNKSVAGLLDLFAQRFSDEQIKQTTANLQALQFPHFEGTFTTEDFLKKYGDQILKQVATTAFDVLDPALGKVIAGFDGTGESLTKFIGSLLIFDDVAKKLPDDVRDSLISAIGNTQEGLDKVTQFAGAFMRITDVFNGSLLEDAFKVVQAQNQSFATTVVQMGTNLADLASGFDGSATAATNLASATEAYYQAQVQLLAQLEQVKQSISSLFEDTIRSLTLQTLDNAGKGNFLNDEISRLQEQLFSSSDPQQIHDLAARINDDINQLFGLLTPEEQQQQLGTFTDNIRELNDEVVARISEVESATQDAAQGVLTLVQTALADAVAAMQTAADTQQAAADTQLIAAETPIQVDPVIVYVPTSTSETNG